MYVETEIQAVIRTSLGDSFDKNPSKEEIERAVDEHIEDFCKEHDLEFDDVKILNQSVIED